LLEGRRRRVRIGGGNERVHFCREDRVSQRYEEVTKTVTNLCALQSPPLFPFIAREWVMRGGELNEEGEGGGGRKSTRRRAECADPS